MYFERTLSPELSISLDGWNSSSRDSVISTSYDYDRYRIYRNTYNDFNLTYKPFDWFDAETGLRGTRSHSDEVDRTEGSTLNTGKGYAAKGYVETTTSTDLIYSNFYVLYGHDRNEYYGQESFDRTLSDEADLFVQTEPCTLGFSHAMDRHSTWSDRGDTINLSLSKIPFLSGWFATGGQAGRRRYLGDRVDYEQYGAELWLKDSLRITSRVGMHFTGTYSVDTLNNYYDENNTYCETDRDLDARLNYQPFRQTNIRLDFNNESSIHDQVDDGEDEERNKIAFTGHIDHSFFRRPSQATNPWGYNVTPVSPGYLSFSHYLSLERIRTPDTTDALDRDRYYERLSLSASLLPVEMLSTYLMFSHYIQRTIYVDTVNTSNAASSYETKSSYANWYLEFEIPEYVDVSNNISISFDWTNYYLKPQQNRADRLWEESGNLTLYPQSLLRPEVDFYWERYENWRMSAGQLTRTGLKDVFQQRYGVSLVLERKEEAPAWSWVEYWDKKWLEITSFIGIKTEIVAGYPKESTFAGLETLIRPWTYIQLNGSIKFTRSELDEVPFNASMSVYSSF